MADAFIGLGSNQGEREHYLSSALEALRSLSDVNVLAVSSTYETAPVGGSPGQGAYLNAVAHLEVNVSPHDLLQHLLTIERQHGRERRERFGPRTIDLDLLLFDDLVMDSPELVLPHPRMNDREFVLLPLLEIAPEIHHPVLKKSIRDLYIDLRRREISAPRRALDLAGLKAMVTGSTSGIGRAIALELASAGADVIVHGARSIDRAHEVAEQIRALDCASEVIMADLQDQHQIEKLMEQAWSLWHGLDIWINNAGSDTLTGEAAKWSYEEKLAILWQVDVLGTIELSRGIGARMQRQSSGVILNMGWDQAETGMEGDSGEIFATTKGSIMAFSRSLALSLAPRVRVNCLAPGWIRTAWGEQASKDWQDRAMNEAPLQRWGDPEDVARAAHWLVSPGSSFITGQIIRVNGGAVR